MILIGFFFGWECKVILPLFVLTDWYTIDLPAETTMSSTTFDFEETIFAKITSPRIFNQPISWTISNNQNSMVVIICAGLSSRGSITALPAVKNTSAIAAKWTSIETGDHWTMFDQQGF